MISDYRPMRAIKRTVSSENESEFGIRIYDGVFGRTDIFPLINTAKNLTRWHFGSSDLALEQFSIEDWDEGYEEKILKMLPRFSGRANLVRSNSWNRYSKKLVTEAGAKKSHFFENDRLNEFTIMITPKNHHIDDREDLRVGRGELTLGQKSCLLELELNRDVFRDYPASFHNGSGKFFWAQLTQSKFPRDICEYLNIWKARNAYTNYIVPNELLKSGHISNAVIFPKNIENAFTGARTMGNAQATVSVKIDQVGWSSK